MYGFVVFSLAYGKLYVKRLGAGNIYTKLAAPTGLSVTETVEYADIS